MVSRARLFSTFNAETGAIDGCPIVSRRLSDLRDLFVDAAACEERLKSGDPLLYTVSSFDAAEGEGQLHCGLGIIHPGRIGAEYFMTRGHLHAHREAAEIYIGLRGTGLMHMQEEDGTGERIVDLFRDSIVYVPGHTAHRTINTGDQPLVYLGVYPAQAGHDYEAVRNTNFRSVVIARDGRPAIVSRTTYIDDLQRHRTS